MVYIFVCAMALAGTSVAKRSKNKGTRKIITCNLHVLPFFYIRVLVVVPYGGPKKYLRTSIQRSYL